MTNNESNLIKCKYIFLLKVILLFIFKATFAAEKVKMQTLSYHQPFDEKGEPSEKQEAM